jgi:glycosyltransferase involved in cell wall biosynthesis
METTRVSIITTTYNEEENIGKLIERIRKLNLNTYIIVLMIPRVIILQK